MSHPADCTCRGFVAILRAMADRIEAHTLPPKLAIQQLEALAASVRAGLDLVRQRARRPDPQEKN